MAAIPIEKQNEKIKSYFKSVFMDYLVNDLQTLLDSSLDEKNPGGCSAPLAMTVFSAMNQLGYLTRKKDTEEALENAGTEECIKEFCNDWMAKVNKNYRKSTIQEIMVHFFRHGLAHQFISIATSAITRDPKQVDLIKIYSNQSGRKGIVLQIGILAKDFLEAISLLQEKIESAMERDTKFIMKFFNRLNSQLNKHIDNSVSLYEKAERNLEFTKVEGEIFTSTTSGTTTITKGSDTTVTA